jgi:hypothetical protein
VVAVGAGGIRRAELMEVPGPMKGYGDTDEEPTEVAGHDVVADGEGMVCVGRDRVPDLVTHGDGAADPYPLG